MERPMPNGFEKDYSELARFIDGSHSQDVYLSLFKNAETYIRGFRYGIGEPLLKYTGTPKLMLDRLVLSNFYGKDTTKELYWCGYQTKLLGDLLSKEHPNAFVYFAAGAVHPIFMREEPPSHAWLMVSGSDLYDAGSEKYDLEKRPLVIIDPVFRNIEPLETNSRYKPAIVVPIENANRENYNPISDETIYEDVSLPLMLTDQGLIAIRLVNLDRGFALSVHLALFNRESDVAQEFMRISCKGKNIQLQEHFYAGLPDNITHALMRLVKRTQHQQLISIDSSKTRFSFSELIRKR